MMVVTPPICRCGQQRKDPPNFQSVVLLYVRQRPSQFLTLVPSLVSMIVSDDDDDDDDYGGGGGGSDCVIAVVRNDFKAKVIDPAVLLMHCRSFAMSFIFWFNVATDNQFPSHGKKLRNAEIIVIDKSIKLAITKNKNDEYHTPSRR